MIIIGDIHGCFETFLALLKQLPKDEVVLCGDLIDRGPKSYQVVQYVIDHKIHCVKGNHEDMMVKHTGKDHYSDPFLYNGGEQTLASYAELEPGVFTPNTKKFKEHQKWLGELPTYLDFPDVKNKEGRHLLVTHAGINRLDLQKFFTLHDVMWNREPELDVPGIYNVHGHTPIDKPQITKYFANIDTGACFGSRLKILGHEKSPYGKLTALQFPSMKIWQQERID